MKPRAEHSISTVSAAKISPYSRCTTWIFSDSTMNHLPAYSLVIFSNFTDPRAFPSIRLSVYLSTHLCISIHVFMYLSITVTRTAFFSRPTYCGGIVGQQLAEALVAITCHLSKLPVAGTPVTSSNRCALLRWHLSEHTARFHGCNLLVPVQAITENKQEQRHRDDSTNLGRA